MTPREMIQSTGRPRDVTTNEIIVAIDKRLCVQDALPPDYDMDFDYEQELSKIMERRNMLDMMNESVDSDGKIEWAPNHIAKIFPLRIVAYCCIFYELIHRYNHNKK